MSFSTHLKSSVKDAMYIASRMLVPRTPSAIILIYHSVGDNDRPFTVPPDSFARQMRWLREANFNIVSLDELARYRGLGRIPQKTVAITFDDGYEDNYINAFPVLERHRIPATIFITTGDLRGKSIDSIPPLPKMSEDQLRRLHESGLLDIEPHSETHQQFSNISEAEIEYEARESKSYVEALLTKRCRHFAYPKGSYSKAAQRILARSEISFAYTTDVGRVRLFDDPYALKRNGIGRKVTLTQFKGIALIGHLIATSVLSKWKVGRLSERG